MEIKTERYKDWSIVTLNASFTVSTMFAVRTELEQLEKTAPANVALDFTAVKNIDSSAINLMLNYARRLAAKNGQFTIFNINSEIKEIFYVVSFEDSVPIFNNRQDFEKSVA